MDPDPMGLPSRIPAVVAWIVVALVVAWAPLLHAICIAPAESAAATHVMADGTVMSTAAPSGETGHAGHSAGGEPVGVESGAAVGAVGAVGAVAAVGVATLAAALPETLAIAGPSVTLLDATGVVGAIVVFAGMAVLTIAMFVRRCRVLPTRGDPPRRRTTGSTRRDIRARHSTDVDLLRLGISRT
ncbi:hypothetical protein [Agromyces bauzanensis]